MTREAHSPTEEGARRGRLIRERVHDTYKLKRKLPDPTVCGDCGAIFHLGRWQWMPCPPGAHEDTCPACERVREKDPAGILRLSGSFLAGHREELLNTARNVEAREKVEHPLKRIIEIRGSNGGVTITTTDPHLARGIGEALKDAYQGDLTFRYTEEDTLARVAWKR